MKYAIRVVQATATRQDFGPRGRAPWYVHFRRRSTIDLWWAQTEKANRPGNGRRDRGIYSRTIRARLMRQSGEVPRWITTPSTAPRCGRAKLARPIHPASRSEHRNRTAGPRPRRQTARNHLRQNRAETRRPPCHHAPDTFLESPPSDPIDFPSPDSPIPVCPPLSAGSCSVWSFLYRSWCG